VLGGGHVREVNAMKVLLILSMKKLKIVVIVAVQKGHAYQRRDGVGTIKIVIFALIVLNSLDSIVVQH